MRDAGRIPRHIRGGESDQCKEVRKAETECYSTDLRPGESGFSLSGRGFGDQNTHRI